MNILTKVHSYFLSPLKIIKNEENQICFYFKSNLFLSLINLKLLLWFQFPIKKYRFSQLARLIYTQTTALIFNYISSPYISWNLVDYAWRTYPCICFFVLHMFVSIFSSVLTPWNSKAIGEEKNHHSCILLRVHIDTCEWLCCSL